MKLGKTLKDIKHEVGNLKAFAKLVHKMDNKAWFLVFATAAVTAMIPFITVLIPKLILDELMGAQRTVYFVSLVIGAALLDSILTIAKGKLDTLLQGKFLEVQEKFGTYLSQYITKMDYERLEDPKELDEKEKAIMPFLQGGVWNSVHAISSVLSSVLTIIGLTAIIITLDVWIILFMLVAVIINMKLYKKVQKGNYEIEQEDKIISREVSYCEKVTSDFAAGKDIRIYAMRPMLNKRISDTLDKFRKFVQWAIKKVTLLSGMIRMISEFQIVVVYAYMVFKVLYRGMTIANFTMYSSAASRFSAALSTLFDNIVWVRFMSTRMEPFMKFVGKEPKIIGTRKADEIDDSTMEFSHVSFKYPRTDRYILNDVSITIKPGEKLSVVGLNGAGKTTFIKLLARLYNPNKGEIKIGGVNINEFSYEEYTKLLGVVFQDFKIFSFSIRENVAVTNSGLRSKEEDDRINDALLRAGLKEKIESLPKGIDTALYKIFDEDGIEFSGGQNQKLAIARAIYKNSPIVILDEPTAALDPISEFEIYSRFNELIGNKTAIYISHRLSSCRFCDRIAVFENGTISQLGCHDELIKDTGGQYAKMYNAQAKYYV